MSFDGLIEDPRTYNTTLSENEILEIAKSRIRRSVSRGLAFHPVLYGASGLSNFDGTILEADNKIICDVSGVKGTPVGSPIGRGNTIQRIY